MTNQQRDKSNSESCFKIVKNDCLGKIFKSEIFTTKVIDRTLKSSALSLNQMNDDQKTQIM